MKISGAMFNHVNNDKTQTSKTNKDDSSSVSIFAPVSRDKVGDKNVSTFAPVPTDKQRGQGNICT
jgi:hypothetical protein